MNKFMTHTPFCPLFARPQDGGVPEEILEREAAVSSRLQGTSGTRRGETVEPQV